MRLQTFLIALLSAAVVLVAAPAPAPAQGPETEITNPVTGDTWIENRIIERLARSSSLAGSQVTVRVENRAVTLEGTVIDEDARQRAERIVRGIAGVRSIENDLQLDEAAIMKRRDVSLDDEKLAAVVAKKLADDTFPGAEAHEAWTYGWEVDGYGWEFDVEADGGAITLEGTVFSVADVTRAVQAARETLGVESVDSNLVPEGWQDGWGYGTFAPTWGPWGVDADRRWGTAGWDTIR